MALEIERKFLVANESFRAMAHEKHHLVQAYLSRDPDRTIRIRIYDEQAFLTIKSRNHGAVRHEWEYEIPLSDARELLGLCRGGVISKWRHIVPFGGRRWEVDEFENKLAGLIVAEVELDDDKQSIELPPFAGEEVTSDPAYYNSSLAARCD